MRKFILPLVVALASTASAATLTLQDGQTGMLGNQKVILLSVKDSRCPINARCIRAGELIATLLVSKNNRLKLLKLSFPEAPNTTWAGLRISGASDKLAESKLPTQITLSDQP